MPWRGHDEPVPLLAYSAESGIGRVVRALRSEALEGLHAEPVVDRAPGHVAERWRSTGRGVAWLPRSLIEDELASAPAGRGRRCGWSVAVEIRLFRQRSAAPPAAEALWRAAALAGVPPAA